MPCERRLERSQRVLGVKTFPDSFRVDTHQVHLTLFTPIRRLSSLTAIVPSIRVEERGPASSRVTTTLSFYTITGDLETPR